MDAVEFLHTWAKICNEARCCINCPLYGACQGSLCGIPKEMFGKYKPNYQHIEPDAIVEAVKQVYREFSNNGCS